jgi:hypothetical protein
MATTSDLYKKIWHWRGGVMDIEELVIRFQDNIWQVRLGERLLSGQPTQAAALSVAQAIAHAAADRGSRSRIFVFNVDGSSIEFPVIGPTKRRA